jgi:hypothetical protein
MPSQQRSVSCFLASLMATAWQIVWHANLCIVYHCIIVSSIPFSVIAGKMPNRSRILEDTDLLFLETKRVRYTKTAYWKLKFLMVLTNKGIDRKVGVIPLNHKSDSISGEYMYNHTPQYARSVNVGFLCLWISI